MHSLLKNKFVRFGLAVVGVLAVIFIVLLLVSAFATNQYRLNVVSETSFQSPKAMFDDGYTMEADMAMSEAGFATRESSYYPHPPTPAPTGYTADLESYETTAYSINGRTSEFDAFCSTLSGLKQDDAIHFKSLNQSTNHCNATLFVEAAAVDSVLATLTSFKHIEYDRHTESVTRHRQQLESQTSILEQQLASVSRSLTAAETQFDELAAFARATNDAEALSEAIRYKLQNVDTLTQRKINLTARLNDLYQQSADLAERMNVVEFDVYVSRANPITVGKYERQWSEAWEELQDQFNDALINLTAFFGVFLLWGVQAVVYLLILLVILRGLWKFAKLLWRKW